MGVTYRLLLAPSAPGNHTELEYTKTLSLKLKIVYYLRPQVLRVWLVLLLVQFWTVQTRLSHNSPQVVWHIL